MPPIYEIVTTPAFVVGAVLFSWFTCRHERRERESNGGRPRMRLASIGAWMALMVAFGVACSDGGEGGGDDSSGKDVVSVDPNESAEACCRVFGSEQEDECIEIDQHRACTEVEQCKALNPTGDGCACSLCYGQKCIEVECRGAPTGGGEDAF